MDFCVILASCLYCEILEQDSFPSPITGDFQTKTYLKSPLEDHVVSIKGLMQKESSKNNNFFPLRTYNTFQHGTQVLMEDQPTEYGQIASCCLNIDFKFNAEICTPKSDIDQQTLFHMDRTNKGVLGI